MDSSSSSSFGFSKDYAVISRKPSFSESLKAVLHQSNPVEPGSLRGGAYLLKRSTTGAWQKRFFILHNHYLTYYSKDPLNDTAIQPIGSLDLWSVSTVTLDDAVLRIHLSPSTEQARRQAMGAAVLRDAKAYVRNLHVPGASIAKTVVKQLETTRRGHSSSTLELKASSAIEAQLWLKALRESPLIGTLSSLPQPEQQGGETPLVRIADVRVTLGHREIVFSRDSLGAADLLLRGVPASGVLLVVTLEGQAKPVTGRLQPPNQAPSGLIEMPAQDDFKVCVEWERSSGSTVDFWSHAVGAFVCASLAGLLFAPFYSAALLGLFAAASYMALSTSTQSNDIILKRVYVHSIAGDALRPTLRKLTQAATTSSRRKMKSEDLNVTDQEVQQLAELRERLADLYEAPADTHSLVRRHQAFLKQYGADLGNLTDLAKRKASIDLHLNGSDFRAVRFLRARKHSVDKAEIMVRDSLTWRIALGTDSILNSFEVPDWLVQYAGSPVFCQLKRPVDDSHERFERFWVRDRQGNLCIFLRQGPLSSRRIYKKLQHNAAFLIKCLLWTAELARHDLDRMHNLTKGKVDSTVTAIVDLDGFAVSNQIPVTDLVGLARTFFPIFSTSYPELLKRVIVVRAPFLFAGIWGALSPFIPEEVLDKIHIHSGAVDVTKVIFPFVEESHVPAYLGGRLVDETGDDLCVDRFPPSGPFMEDQGAQMLIGMEERAVKS